MDLDKNGAVNFTEFAKFLRVDDHELDSAIHKQGNRFAPP